jgi:serine/threonine protein kinase
MTIGDLIDDYEIIEHIDSGGMGSVYKANKSGIDYALKFCNSTDSKFTKRFQREVRLMKSIQDSNILQVVDENLGIDNPYFVMPLCDESLLHAVNRGLSEDEKFTYVKQFCKGVQNLHAAGVIHRDIKPNNALILNNEVKVSDLGLGKFMDRDSSILTPTFATLGTPSYIPPEIYKDGDGRGANERSDIYSLGCLIYFVFSNGDNPLFVDSSKIRADIFSIINKCMKISPNDRYQSVSEVINALNICDKARNSPVSIKDLVSSHKTGVNDPDFAEKICHYLLTLQDDLGTLIDNFGIIGIDNFRLILEHEKQEVGNLINLLCTAYNNNNNNYWIQFADVELLVQRAHILLQNASQLQEKQDLLEFSISISENYNRYPAMKIVGEMLHDLSDDEMKALSAFFSTQKQAIDKIKECFAKPIPEIILSYLR